MKERGGLNALPTIIMAIRTLREALAGVEEFEKRKHVTHVGFVILTIYRDEKPIKKVMARPEYDHKLCEAIEELVRQYKVQLSTF